jgi:hypothetical protein
MRWANSNVAGIAEIQVVAETAIGVSRLLKKSLAGWNWA